MSSSLATLALRAVSVLLHVAALAAFVATLQALTVASTLAAVESAFGTFVLCIMLLVFARKSWTPGKNHSKSTD